MRWGFSPLLDYEMNTVKIKAYAKVNLTLEIVGLKDGYHLLDSFVASVDLFDLIVLKKRKGKLSRITMKGRGSESIPPEKNNALKAAELFSEKFQTDDADITVYKNIPMGAGLGGSSADAAGVLNGMAKLYGIDDAAALGEIADALGSDTKYMLTGGYARMQGRGTEITKISSNRKLNLLLLCPKTSVNTGACYSEFDRINKEENGQNYTQNAIDAFLRGDENELGRYLMNDLYLPAARLNMDVKEAYQKACSFSPLGAAMSGSGSAAFALFETRELCEWAKSRYIGKAEAIVVKTIVPEYETKDKLFKNPFALSQDEVAQAMNYNREK